MSGDNHSFVGQLEDRVVQGAQNFLHGPPRQVRAPDRSSEESVSGDEFLLGGEVETDAAFRVSRRVKNVRGERSGRDGFSGRDAAVDFDFSRCGDADPCRLHVEHLEQSVVVLIEKNWSARGSAKLHGSADMVNVGVRDDDLLDLKIVFLE